MTLNETYKQGGTVAVGVTLIGIGTSMVANNTLPALVLILIGAALILVKEVRLDARKP